MNNKPYLLALNRISSIGPRTVAKLLGRWPHLEELFRLTVVDMKRFGLPERLAQAIVSFDLHLVEIDLQWEEASNHFLITLDDERYPYLLREIHDPPPVLYAIGELSAFLQPTVAMVGTRKPSVTGSETAWRFAFELASQHITIVSGLALGIDAKVHLGTIAALGQTIAVLGTGIDCIYPRQHKDLAAKITEKGLLLSEFPLQSPPIAGHFPRRNRIISGLSLSTLVVEAAIRSGSLITARLACEQNRDVFAIPGSICNPQARGCHHLLQEGAKLVTSSQDILEELRMSDHLVGLELEDTLASQNENLVKFIGFEVTSIDQIIARCGLSVERVACDLAELEIQGMVKAVPGGYMRCMV